MICFYLEKRSHYSNLLFQRALNKEKTENLTVSYRMLKLILSVFKHPHFISKYHWMNRANFLKLSAGSAFLFLIIGPKPKI